MQNCRNGRSGRSFAASSVRVLVAGGRPVKAAAHGESPAEHSIRRYELLGYSSNGSERGTLKMVTAASTSNWHGEIAFSIVEADEEHVRAIMPVTPGILNPL